MNKIIMVAALVFFLCSCGRTDAMDENAEPLGIYDSDADILYYFELDT